MTMQVRFINQPRLQVRVVALPSSSGGSGAVSSVFGRTGTVVASSGDYTGSQITNVPSGTVTATNVQSAINQLAAGGAAITPAALTAVNDTNVTASLGGLPTTALLQATSVTLGWTGTLAIARGGTGTSTFTPFVGSPLLKVDDTNVTLAWSGASATAVSGTTTVTAGWTGTLAVARGGTGSSTWATNTVFVGGTTSTGTFKQVTSGTSGTVLMSQGAGVLPIFGSIVGTGITTFTITTYTSGSATFTRNASTTFADVEVVGGGGAGGGVTGTLGDLYVGAGGGSGGYSRSRLTAAQLGSTQTVTVGPGGTGVSAGTGNAGGTSTFGTLVKANGGGGGVFSDNSNNGVGGAGGPAGTGTIAAAGTPGQAGFYNADSFTIAMKSGGGASSFFGGGATSSAAGTGTTAGPYGGGGSGAAVANATTAFPGGAGSNGIIIVTEYW